MRAEDAKSPEMAGYCGLLPAGNARPPDSIMAQGLTPSGNGYADAVRESTGVVDFRKIPELLMGLPRFGGMVYGRVGFYPLQSISIPPKTNSPAASGRPCPCIPGFFIPIQRVLWRLPLDTTHHQSDNPSIRGCAGGCLTRPNDAKADRHCYSVP